MKQNLQNEAIKFKLNELHAKAKAHPDYRMEGDQDDDLWAWVEAYGTLKDYKFLIKEAKFIESEVLPLILVTLIGVRWKPSPENNFYFRFAEQKFRYLLSIGAVPPQKFIDLTKNQKALKILSEYGLHKSNISN